MIGFNFMNSVDLFFLEKIRMIADVEDSSSPFDPYKYR